MAGTSAHSGLKGEEMDALERNIALALMLGRLEGLGCFAPIKLVVSFVKGP